VKGWLVMVWFGGRGSDEITLALTFVYLNLCSRKDHVERMIFRLYQVIESIV